MPLVAHIIHRFGTGGLENGMVNLLNNFPEPAYRHAVICLEGFTEFRRRVTSPRVHFYDIEKKPGKDPSHYWRLWRLLRSLKPDLVHTRNLSGLEGQFVAWAAGVGARVHGEHGRDVFDLHGANSAYNRLRRLARPLVRRYIPVSRDLEQWLVETVGATPERIKQIYNGVDQSRFRPRAEGEARCLPEAFSNNAFVIGTVGRLAAVKDQPTLVRAFVEASKAVDVGDRLRLVIVGDGELRAECERLLAEAGLSDRALFPGDRDDVPDFLRSLDLFVLPSLGEGISNTILEAMSSGL